MVARLLTLTRTASIRAFDSESANQLTHALGLVLSLIGAGVMLTVVSGSSDLFRIVGCTVYMLSLVALYAASTLSHSFAEQERRDFYRMLDQVCIFLLVAGTYTPFGLVHARDGGWWVLLAAMWLCALCGISVRIRGRRSVPAVFYVVLGWLPLLAMGRAAEVGEWWGMTLVIAGGLAYTCGTWFLANDRRHPYFHAVWHLCTIAGSACHYLFLLQYVAMERA